MVGNKEKDVKSLDSEVFVPVVEEKNLWVDLKIPNYELGNKIDDDPKIMFEHKDDQIMKISSSSSNDTERVCEICGKSFKSGKALGGHMRIHVQQSKNQDLVSNSSKIIKIHKPMEFKNKEIKDHHHNMVNKRPTCSICGKRFPSMKSLYGHMKSHPERCWRGIQPPPPPLSSVVVVSKNSSSSSLSEVDDQKNNYIDDDDDDDDEMRVFGGGEKIDNNKDVDLMGELWGWKVTARRGRKSVESEASSSEEEDIQMLNAANELMLMANGVVGGQSEAKDHVEIDLDSKPKRRKMDQLRQLENGDECSNYEENNQLDNKIDNGTDDHELKENDHAVMMKSKKKRKKVKLCDLAQINNNGDDKHYKCNTCGKSFSTFQALGGHRSSHSINKVKIVIIQQNSILNESDHKANLSTAQLVEGIENNGTKGLSSTNTTCDDTSEAQRDHNKAYGESNQRLLDIDLNEMPQSNIDEA